MTALLDAASTADDDVVAVLALPLDGRYYVSLLTALGDAYGHHVVARAGNGDELVVVRDQAARP